MPNWRREELFEAVAAVVARGFQAHIHAIGDAGIRNALDAFEHARKVGGKLINPVIAHSQLIDPADLPRFKELDVIANFEPLWAQLANEQVVLTIPRLGQERADRQYPMATLLHSGTKISFGSDWPVTSPVPMEGIGIAITRQTDEEFPPGGWVPHERLTLNEALTAYTMGTAVRLVKKNSGVTWNWQTCRRSNDGHRHSFTRTNASSQSQNRWYLAWWRSSFWQISFA
jgi:predicted amidohydrolase YtcJ